jgi:hypothetical protein
MRREELLAAIKRLDGWIERSGWEGWDTFDGLASPLAPIFTLNIPMLCRFWQQGIRRFPLNLRRIVGIKKAKASKAMGFCAQGYLTLYQTYGRDEYLEKARFCLRWLADNPSHGYSGHCWGNHFEYESRAGRIPKGIPTTVWTSLIGHAFLNAYESLEDDTYLKIARSACEFILRDLWHRTESDTICLGYTPLDKEATVHNSNALGASLLSRVYHHTSEQHLLQVATRAFQFTANDQRKDGAWYYGADKKYKWVDCFHTGYVLESFYQHLKYTGDESFRGNLELGYKFFRDTFFENNGTPRYYDTKRTPLDIQCASQGIQTLVTLKELYPNSLQIAQRVAAWTISNMWDRAGFFYYRKYPFVTNKTPTLHWGQATMLSALALLAAEIK